MVKFAGHGPQTGLCIPTDKPDKYGNISVCEIRSWCPVEDDQLLLGKERPLITGSEHHTVFIKNSIRFSYFGEQFHRNNMPDSVCLYNFSDPDTWLCNIFKLGNNYRPQYTFGIFSKNRVFEIVNCSYYFKCLSHKNYQSMKLFFKQNELNSIEK